MKNPHSLMNPAGASAAALAWLFLVTPAAHGAVIASDIYEGFDYPAGDALSLKNGGTGFTAGWADGGATPVIGGASLSYPGLTTTGNSAVLNALSGTAQIFRPLGQTLDEGTFYFSYLTQLNATTGRSTNLALYQGVSGIERISIGQLTGGYDSMGAIVLNLNNNGAVGVRTTTGTPIPYAGGTHLIIGRVDFNASGVNERVRIYINPTSFNEALLTPYIDDTSTNIGSIDAIRPFVGGVSGAIPASNATFDEIRFGASFGSVIPEPGSSALLVLGGAAFLSRRRRS